MADWCDGGGSAPDNEREAERALRQARLEEVVRGLAKSPDGREFLRFIVHGAGVFRAVYPPSHAEAAFLEGRRSVGLTVLQICVNVGAGDALLNNNEVDDG